jgi:hypothetical protein
VKSSLCFNAALLAFVVISCSTVILQQQPPQSFIGWQAGNRYVAPFLVIRTPPMPSVSVQGAKTEVVRRRLPTNYAALILAFDLPTNGVVQYEVVHGPAEGLLATNFCPASNNTISFWPTSIQNLFRVRAIGTSMNSAWSSNFYVNAPTDVCAFNCGGKSYAGFMASNGTWQLVAIGTTNAAATLTVTSNSLQAIQIPDSQWYRLRH